MPYINQERREHFEELGIPVPTTGGELQYLIAAMIDEMLTECHYTSEGVRYAELEKIMGALSGAQQEFYRQVVAPYEDKKIKESGGVYSTEVYLGIYL